MSEPDTRETLDPAWEKLARARSELVWDVCYCELWSPQREPTARTHLTAWERAHSEEWNRLKPWYEVRLKGEDHEENENV